jgi:hypothetical protein
MAELATVMHRLWECALPPPAWDGHYLIQVPLSAEGMRQAWRQPIRRKDHGCSGLMSKAVLPGRYVQVHYVHSDILTQS